MPGQGREIRRRIKSIRSTRQITKAMEMVSAAKMRRAVAHVLATRPYATLAWEMVRAIVAKTKREYHPFLMERPVIKKVCMILVTSNRGLAGSFNTNVIEMARRYVHELDAASRISVDFIIMGNKGKIIGTKYHHAIVADFPKPDVSEKIEEVRPVVGMVREEYLKGTYGRIVVAYTDFASTFSQKPRILQLLPIAGKDLSLGATDDMRPHAQAASDASQATGASMEDDGYLFEPSPENVLDALLPRLVEVQLYQAILESDASEHSARMFAMRNASDAAGEMMDELTLRYNQTRQAGITQEIAEISAGRIAIER